MRRISTLSTAFSRQLFSQKVSSQMFDILPKYASLSYFNNEQLFF